MASRRFLAPGGRQGPGKNGYIPYPERPYPDAPDEPETVARIAAAVAMCDEPEAPSKAWVDAECELAAERNRRRLEQRAREARAARGGISIQARILDVQRRAKRQHVNVTRDLFMVGKALERGKVADASARLERVEALLDGVPLETAA